MEHVYSLLVTMGTPLQRVKESCYNEKATTLKRIPFSPSVRLRMQ